ILKLPHGIPSHDTLEWVFGSLDPRGFERCCVMWLRAVADLVGLGHIAIDGKTLCGSASSKLAQHTSSTLGPPKPTCAWVKLPSRARATKSRPFRNFWSCWT